MCPVDPPKLPLLYLFCTLEMKDTASPMMQTGKLAMRQAGLGDF